MPQPINDKLINQKCDLNQTHLEKSRVTFLLKNVSHIDFFGKQPMNQQRKRAESLLKL